MGLLHSLTLHSHAFNLLLSGKMEVNAGWQPELRIRPAGIRVMLRRISNLKAATSFDGMLLEGRSQFPPNVRYEGAWTDSWTHRRCLHQHPTLREAAECVIPEGPAWYVFAIQNGKPRELTDAEERSLEEFRRERHLLKRSHGKS